MKTMSGGDAVYKALRAIGVDCIFGIPSQHNLGFYDALCRHGDIRVIGARHEQGAVHAADGYSRATGRLGVAVVSTGPGTANAMNGLYESAYASSRVLLITTQIDSCYLGKGKGFIHDAEQQLAMLRTVTRSAECVRYPDDIAAAIFRAAAAIQKGRPQPCAVEIPTDFLSRMMVDTDYRYVAPESIEPEVSDIDAAISLLATARRPLIWVGGGAVGASAEIQLLAERLNAPVVSTVNGRGVIAHNHPLYVGCATHLAGFRALLQEADTVLAVGTRFQALASGFWTLPMPTRLIHLDVDAGVINRNFRAQSSIVADARLGVAALLERSPALTADPDYLKLSGETRRTLEANIRALIGSDHDRLSAIISELLPGNRPMVCDATMTGNTWGNYLLPVTEAGTAHYSTSLAIGPALPLGIGAAIGTGRKTLIIHGDGGVMLNLSELAMAVEAGAPIILCIFNDGGYGVLKGLQEADTKRPFGVKLHTPDFVGIARAMGACAIKVDGAESFKAALTEAVEHSGPYVIEIDLSRMNPIGLLG